MSLWLSPIWIAIPKTNDLTLISVIFAYIYIETLPISFPNFGTVTDPENYEFDTNIDVLQVTPFYPTLMGVELSYPPSVFFPDVYV